MKNILFVLVFVAAAFVPFVMTRGEDSNSPAQKVNIDEMREKGLRRPPPSVDRAGRQDEINRLKNLSREERREEMRKMREKRRREIEATKGIRAPGATPPRGAPANPKQLEALQKQIAHEDAKYLKRAARLKRIRQLAVEENNQEIIARVDKLLMREQNRHSNKSSRLRTQKRTYDRIKRDTDRRQLDKERTTEAINKARRDRGKPRPPAPAEKPATGTP